MEQKNKIHFLNYTALLDLVFFLFLILVVINHLLIFKEINLSWIDSDQPFMWAGVKDYSEGKFYEPRFYGQDYNTFIEALVAVPFYWLNVPVYYALPIATHLLSLFPFLFPALYLFTKGKKENALIVLAVLLCLPVGYDIMSSIPRGFVGGLFFTSFFIISLLNPRDLRFVFLNTFLAVIGYFVNPNSVIVSVPFMFFLLLHNYKEKRYYAFTGLALSSIIPLYFLFDYFYKIHPSYVILNLNYIMTGRYFFEILSSLDKHFAHISFFREENCFFLLLILITFALYLFQKNRKAFYTFLGFIGIILFSFFSSKVNEGVVWPFYSYSRMYLGIPLFIALLVSFVAFNHRIITISLIALSVGFCVFKFLGFKKEIAYHLEEHRWNGVHLIALSSVLDANNVYNEACKKNNASRLIISNTFWLCTYLNYGGPVIQDNFPATEETAAERRYWVREENKNKVFPKFVFISVNYDFDKLVDPKGAFKITRIDNYGLFLIEENTLKNREFIALTRKLE